MENLKRHHSVMTLFLYTVMTFLLVSNAQAAIIGQISFLLGAPGDIEILTTGNKTAKPATLKMAVQTGDIVTTKPESRCEITLQDGAIVRIGENSTFQFNEANLKKKNQKVKAELSGGNVWVNLSKTVTGKKDFQIKAPTAVCAVRGTIYRIEADSATTCVVYDGAVAVGPVGLWGKTTPKSLRSGPPQQVPGPTQIPGPYQVSLEQWQQIVKGFQITVRNDGKYAKTRFDEKREAENDWVKWNKELDAKENQ